MHWRSLLSPRWVICTRKSRRTTSKRRSMRRRWENWSLLWSLVSIVGWARGPVHISENQGLSSKPSCVGRWNADSSRSIETNRSRDCSVLWRVLSEPAGCEKGLGDPSPIQILRRSSPRRRCSQFVGRRAAVLRWWSDHAVSDQSLFQEHLPAQQQWMLCTGVSVERKWSQWRRHQGGALSRECAALPFKSESGGEL